MYVKPTSGLVIRDPDLLDRIPEGGREVPDTDYWHRRVRDGDVVAATPAAPAQTPATERSDEQ
ncbi:DUF2635 domain-containing protein [Janthinobacterium sp.]|uniref:DUF2635 domain-containing protein n=1 Tax=Janthinobacterium sp. TaxID=1871054 RepID=UPI00293D6106|nr:DUF2635 domain-containing protein [Janthinobacterium sp.]